MLTVAALTEIVADVEFWPGWSLTIFEHEFEGPWLRIEASPPNAYALSQATDLGINSPIPPMASRKQFLDWLLWRMRRIGDHEVREGLRYQGKAISDPHKGCPWRTRARAG